ncbi:MAG: GTPase ObgE [Eubacteriales bacterium]|nr:GTPase ObgE [Eubacteriales bacterium]
MFIDKVKITCKAGNGGNGKVHFRREKFVPNGGPEGGDGGRGGSIIFKTTPNMTNLVDFRFTKVFKAGNGEDGGNNMCDGKAAQDLTILVPVGTVIKNASTDKVIADLTTAGEEFLALKGGRGGRGNSKFATSTRQAPRFAEMGEQTKPFELILELKTIADVGLIGYPNVGKSSLLKAVSNAKPKIANYHFTTLSPNIGVVKAYNTSMVWADIPGLIDGASEGVGLGHDFLRHIERTRVLIHVIDAAGSEGRDPYQDYININNELKKYSEYVSHIPQVVALNKIDLIDPDIREEYLAELKNQIGKDVPIFEISAVAFMGLNELIKYVADLVEKQPELVKMDIEEKDIDKRTRKTFEIAKLDDHYYEVFGDLIDEIAFNVIINDYQSFAYFQKRIKDEGIIDALLEAGMKEGDTVKMCQIEFEYTL